MATSVVVAPSARAASDIVVQVNTWDVDQATGKVAYDVTATGSCTSSCSYKVEGFYKDETIEDYQFLVGSGSMLGTPTTPAILNRTFTSPSTERPETTHLRATVSVGGVVATTSWVTVSEPYRDGSITLDVTKWDRNEETAGTFYDVTMTIKGAKQENGPCTSRCFFYIEAWYKDGSVECKQHQLYGYDCLSGCWTVTRRQTSETSGAVQITKEVTHLRAYVKPSSCTDPCTRETYETWVNVSAPYSSGYITLEVTKWERDQTTGRVAYDLTMFFAGAGQVNGPCENVRCYYYIEAWDLSNGQQRQHVISSYDCLSGCWTGSVRRTSESYQAVEVTKPVTHLRAYIKTSSSSCPDPCSREVYDTGFIPVSNHMYKNHDMERSDLLLAGALAANPSFFCMRFLLVAGSHAAGSSLTDQYLACEAAYKAAVATAAAVTVTLLVKAIVDAGGSTNVRTTEDDRPRPAPSRPPPPINQDWEDETGCNQAIPDYSIEVAEANGHIDRDHGYRTAPPGKGKWDYLARWQDYVRYEARWYKAEPQAFRDTCVRVINDRGGWVGQEWVKDPTHPDGGYYLITGRYTVITDKNTGGLVTTYPGPPEL